MFTNFFRYPLADQFLILWTFGFPFVPGVLGYCMGRFVPVGIRAVFVVVLAYFGTIYVAGSYHGFEVFILCNIVYIAGCLSGIRIRSQVLKKTYWDWRHFDWVALVFAMMCMVKSYVPPTQ